MVAAIARPLSVPLTATADAEALGAMAGEGLTGDFPPMGGAAGAALGAAEGSFWVEQPHRPQPLLEPHRVLHLLLPRVQEF